MDPRRQVQSQSQQNVAPRYAEPHAAGAHGAAVRVLIILLIALSLCGIVFFGAKAVAAVTSGGAVKGKQFQAVFLTNGQVYFGKLSDITGSYVKLTDIYYLQVSNSGSQTQVQPGKSSSPQQQVSLHKLGDELHGPEDAMFISRTQVLFWENLKDNGKVVQAINNYQTQNKTTK